MKNEEKILLLAEKLGERSLVYIISARQKATKGRGGFFSPSTRSHEHTTTTRMRVINGYTGVISIKRSRRVLFFHDLIGSLLGCISCASKDITRWSADLAKLNPDSHKSLASLIDSGKMQNLHFIYGSISYY